MKKNNLFVLFFVLCSFFFAACQIGLGSAVDTAAPEFEIEHPEAGKIIRDQFEMHGPLKEDGDIASFKVTLESKAGTSEKIRIEYDVPRECYTYSKKEGSWRFLINPMDPEKPVKDGTYEATVEIKDTAGHTTTQSRTFTVDNTPPVIALTRPSYATPEDILTSEKYDTYGQEFLIEGHCGDSCDRKFIEVKIYDPKTFTPDNPGTPLAVTERQKADSDFSISIAKWGDKIYTALYGEDDEAGTKPFVCTITGYDEAVRYPLGTDEQPVDDTGNSVTYYYLYNGDLYEQGVFSKYTTNDAYKILNDSYSTDPSRESETDDGITPVRAKELLQNDAFFVHGGFFALNPKNNPTFLISGKDPVQSGTPVTADNGYSITKNANIVLEVNPGFDQIPVKEESLGFYVLECDTNGTPKDGAQPIQLVYPEVEWDKTKGQFVDCEITPEQKAKRKIKASGSVFKIEYKLEINAEIGFTTGKTYLAGVNGFDKKGAPIQNAKDKYAFVFTSGSSSTSVSCLVSPEFITTNTDNVISKTDASGFPVSLSQVEITVSIRGEGPYKIERSVGTSENSVLVSSWGTDICKYLDTFDIVNYKNYVQKDGAYPAKTQVTYVITDKNGETVTYIQDVKIDNDRPSIPSSNLVLPKPNDTEGPYFNFTGKAEDASSPVEKVQIRISSAGNSTDWQDALGVNPWKSQLMFADHSAVFGTDGVKTYEVRAYDEAGNYSEPYSTTFVYDTDKPKMTVDSYSVDNGTSWNPITGYASGKFSLKGTATDKYGVEKVVIKQYASDSDTEGVVIETIPAASLSSNTWVVNNLPRDTTNANSLAANLNGTYYYTVEVTDLAGKTNLDSSTKTSFTIDLVDPVVGFTVPANSDPSCSNPLEGSGLQFQGTLSDGDGTGIDKWWYAFKQTEGAPAANSSDWVLGDSNPTTWKVYKEFVNGSSYDGIKLCEGKWYLYVRAADKAGNISTPVSTIFCVDLNVPELTTSITEVPKEQENSVIYVEELGKKYFFDGNLSGVATASDTFGNVTVTFKLSEQEIAASAMTFNAATGAWTIPVTQDGASWKIGGISGLSGKDVILKILATDECNKQKSETYTIFLDKLAPVISIATPAANGAVNDATVNVQGSILEEGIGVDSFQYRTNPADPWTDLGNYTSGTTSWQQNMDITAGTEGLITIYVKATDKLGHDSNVLEHPIQYDKSNPVVTISAPDYVNDGNSTTVSGTAYDTNELKEVWLTVDGDKDKKFKVTVTGLATAKSEATAGTWSYTFPATGTGSLPDGAHNFTAVATDVANKDSTVASDSTFIDRQNPTVTITTPTVYTYCKDTKYEFKGVVTDDPPSSKISNLELKLYKNGSSTAIETQNVTPGSSGEWAYTFYELENTSEYYVVATATDNAGNTGTANSTASKVLIDTVAPSTTLKGTKLYSQTLEAIGASSAEDVEDGQTYYAHEAYTISGTVTETNYDKDKLVLTVTGSSTTAPTVTKSGNNWSFSGTATNGTYRYTIKITDKAGNVTQKNVTVIFDNAAPSAPYISTPSADDTATQYSSGAQKNFSGTAADNEGGTGIAAIKYAFTNSATPPAASSTAWKTQDSGSAWSIAQAITTGTTPSDSALCEGTWYLHMKAVDKAGNETATPSTRKFNIDQGIPTVTVNDLSSGTTYFKTNTYTLTGSATDTNAVAKVEIKDGTTVLETITSGFGSWSKAITIDANAEKEITVVATDVFGRKSADNKFKLYKDQTNPVVEITSPATGAALAYQSDVNLEYKYKATDANIESVQGILYKDGAEDETINLSSGSAVTKKVYDKEEGKYQIKITATDKAGNSATALSGEITIDKTAPSSTVLSSGLYDGDANTIATSTNLVNGTKYFAKDSFSLNGTVTETNFASIALKENGADKTITWNASTKKWSYSPSLTDGTYDYVLTIKDLANNNVSYNFTVVRDTTAPVINITSPTETHYGVTPPVNGTVVENGIGIDFVKWTLDDTDDTSWSENVWTSGTNWSASLAQITTEGSLTLYVKAQDKFGKSSEESVSFSYDLYNPEVTIGDLNDYYKAGYTLTVAGTAGDTNELKSIKLSDGTEPYTWTKGASNNTLTATDASVTLSEASKGRTVTGKNWSKVFKSTDTTPLSQGSHTFTIEAEDTAGKTATPFQKKVFIDTIAPTVVSVELPTVQQTGNDSFRFTGVAKDNENSLVTDSGVKGVKVKFNSYASSTATTPTASTEWLEANGQKSWNYTAVFSDESVNSVFGTNEGYKTISVQAEDEAGNLSTIYESSKFLYDRASPAAAVNSYTPAGGSAITIASGANFFTNNIFTLSATATDGYLVKEIIVKQNGTQIEKISNVNLATRNFTVNNLPRNADNTGALTLNESSSGAYVITIEVEDVAGKTYTNTQITANIDKKKPELSISTPATDLANTSYLSGSSTTFEGTASDPAASADAPGSGVAYYYYQFTRTATQPALGTSAWTKTGFTGGWTIVKSLCSGTTSSNNELYEGHWYLWAYAEDKAGNTSTPISRSFWVDQSAPSLTAAITTSATCKEIASTYYINGGLTGTVSASDTSGTAPALSYKIDDNDAVSISGTTWTIPAASFTTDKSYTVSIIATDACGRSTKKDFVVYRDTTAPTLTIQSPTSGAAYNETKISPKGSVSDAGVGVDQVYYYSTTTQKTVDAVAADTTITWTSLNYTGGASWSNDVTLNDQGTVYFFVKATDKLGKSCTPELVSFSYDRDLPVVTVTDASETNAPTGYDVTVTGKAYDTNLLDYVLITDGTTTYSTKAAKDSSGSARISITNGTVAAAKSEATAITWSIRFKASGTGTYPLTDGQHKLKIIAVDVPTREAEEITKIINVDTTPPEIAITAPTAAAYTKTGSYRFTGTASDVGLGLEKITVQLYNSNNTARGDAEEVTFTNGAWYYIASDLPDANGYYIKATATDRGGNTTTTAASKTLSVDSTAPTTTLTGTSLTDVDLETATSLTNGSTYYASTAYGMSGTITELNLDKAEYKVDDGELTDLTLTGKAWSLTGLTGSHIYTLKFTDLAGNIGTYSITVQFDNTAPTVTVKAPVNQITDGANALDSDTFSFRINAIDNVGGVGVKSIKYGFSSSTTTEPATWITDNNFADGDKYFTMNLVTGKATPTATNLSEGTWYLWAQATDKSHNASSYVKWQIMVDKANPAVTVTNSISTSGVNPIYEGVTSSGYTISGTVTDSNDLDSTAAVVVKVDGITMATLTKANVASGWSYTIPKGTEDGTLVENGLTVVSITAKDVVGKTTTQTYQLFYDTLNPELSVTAPVSGEQVESASKLIKGTVSDEGFGIAELKFELKNEAGTAILKDSDGKDISGTNGSGNYPLTIKGEQWYYAGAGNTATTIPLGTTEGAIKLVVTAKENAPAGHTARSTPVTVDFYYDKADPVLTETGIDTIGKTTKSNFTFSGTAYDSNALSKIEIKEGSTVKASTADGSITITSGAIATAKSEATAASWASTFGVSSYTDGTHIFTVIATDISGKTTQQTRTVVVDTTAPSVDSLEVTTTPTNISGTNWFGTNMIAISATASDTNGSLSVSGVAKVEYTTDAPSASSRTWSPLISGDTFTGTVTFSNQGNNTVYVRAVDGVGNVTSTANEKSVTVKIDSNAPATATAYKADGTTEITEAQLTNGASDITFKVAATDDTSAGTGNYTGIASVALTKVASNVIASPSYITTVTDGKYTITIPAAQLTASGGVEITVKDKVGNAQTFTPFSVTVDKTYPAVKMTAVTDADPSVAGTQINGTTAIAGTASDNATLSSVKLQYAIYNASTSTWGSWTDYTAANNGTIYSWSFNVDTTKTPFTDGNKVRFRGVGTDAAGNTGNSGTTETAFVDTANVTYVECIISQDSDRPIISLNNLTLDDSTGGYFWHKNSTMYGIVTDDDGTVQSVKYKIGSDGTYSANIYSSGMWIITNLTDGNKDIYFQIVDAKGTTFTSSATSTTAGNFGPKIKDSAGTECLGYASSANDILKIKVDVTDPAVGNIKYFTSANATFVEPGTSGWSNIGDLATSPCGGTNRYLYIKYEASDDNGIKSSTAKFGITTALTDITSSTSGTVTTYYKKVDLNGLSSSTYSLQIEATDNANKPTTVTCPIVVDNDAPVITINTPKANETLYGTSNNTVRGEISEAHEISHLYYIVTTSDDVPNKNTAAYADVDAGSLLSWAIFFDGTNGTNEYHTTTFYEKLRVILNKTPTQMQEYDVTTDMYIWLYAIDELGNESLPVSRKFAVVPNGDKPTVEITYPDSETSSVGGTIRLTGGSTIVQDSVNAVYVQIDPSYDGSAFNESGWVTELQGLMTANAVTKYSIVDTGLPSPYDKGILASGTYSWSLSLNDRKELNGTESDGKGGVKPRDISIRSFAVSTTNKKISDWAVKNVAVSTGVPIFGNHAKLELVQFASGCGKNATITNRKDFSDGMYAKGEWYLYGSVEDEGGISWLEFTDASNTAITLVNGTVNSTYANYVWEDTGNAPTEAGTTYKNYMICVPVGNSTPDDYGILSYKLDAKDNQNPAKETIQNYKVNFDNKAPEFSLTKSSSGNVGTDEFGMIYQTNGTYTIRGKFNEQGRYDTIDNVRQAVNQSGFQRIVMYFTRTVGGVTNIIDPMLLSGTSGKDNFYNIANFAMVPAAKNSSDRDVGLYWRPGVVTVGDDGSLTVTSLNGTALAGNIPTTVKTGGLCRIDGVDYRIKKIQENKLYLDGVTLKEQANKAVQFAVAALVIDNEAAESGKTDQYLTTDDSLANGDGDWMVEGATGAGSERDWSAGINSTNILDGSVTVHFFAYDKAGNASYTSFNANVSNNAPRIAGVIYGTDGNGNGVIEENETITQYSGIYTTAKNYKNIGNGYNEEEKVHTYTIKDKLTIKSDLMIKPEIVGGNIGLGYSYDFKSATGTYSSTAVEYAGVGHNSGVDVREDDLSIVISLKDFLKNNVRSGENEMHFTIWDKTEGTAMGTNSNFAKITLNSNVVITDTTSPDNKLKRFYWTDASNNSIYYSNNKPQGHIELEEDWVNASGYNAGNAVYDADAKVSGIIAFEGIATDNAVVEELSITVPGLNGGNTITFAQRDRTAGSSTLGKFKGVTTLAANGVLFDTAEDVFDVVSGKNTVTWRAYVDTAKISSVTASNVQVKVSAKDRGTPSYNADTDKITYSGAMGYNPTSTTSTGRLVVVDGENTYPLTDMYQIDIVPYITGIGTTITDTAGAEMARSATGRYTVAENESIKVYGFNLGTTPVIKLGTTELTGSASGTDDNGAYRTVSVGTTAGSGQVTATVNGITSLNNINTNPVFTSDTDNTITNYVYNSQANGKTSDRFTDDVELYVWQMGNFGIGTNVTSPMLKIDTKSNYYMSYGDGVPEMAVNINGFSRYVDGSYNKFHNTNVAFDDNGNIYAVATNTDRVGDNSARFVFYVPMTNGDKMPDLVTAVNGEYQNSRNTKRHLEQVYNGSTGVYDINRVKRPKMTTYTNGNTTYIAMTYYDYNNTISPVKFRFGKRGQPTMSYTVSNSNVTFTYNSTLSGYESNWYGGKNAATFNNVYTSSSGTTNFNDKYVLINGAYYKLTGSSYYTSNKNNATENFYYTLAYAGNANFTSNTYTQNISGSTSISGGITGNTSGGTGQSNDPTKTDSSYEGYHILASNNTTKKGGEYAAVGIVPSSDGTNGYIGVACWYDASVRKLVYSYNKNPDSAVVGGVWQTNAIYVDDSSYTGWYVDMCVDAAGGIHIAYYNSAKGDLKYAYLSSYNDTTPEVVTVDSYLSVGTNITINTRLENGKHVPYIYYFNASATQTMNSIKVAWRKDMTTLRDGAINDLFTGAWESMIIPSRNIPVDATVCGGVPTDGTWKDKVVLGYMSDQNYDRAVLK